MPNRFRMLLLTLNTWISTLLIQLILWQRHTVSESGEFHLHVAVSWLKACGYTRAQLHAMLDSVYAIDAEALLSKED